VKELNEKNVSENYLLGIDFVGRMWPVIIFMGYFMKAQIFLDV
jgi:hypothetical protein